MYSVLEPAPAGQRASLLMSSAALLLSAAALLVASGGGHSAAGLGAAPLARSEPPPLKRLYPDAHYVRLSQLAIYQDQIVDGAVGPDELQDGAVTSAKLAEGAVTLASLSKETTTELAAALSRARQVTGEVGETGEAIRGSGYSVERISPGEYSLTFATPFLVPPVVLVAAQSYGVCYLPSQHIGEGAVRIKCMSELLTASPLPANTRFSFVASPAF